MYTDTSKPIVFIEKDKYDEVKALADANAEEIEKRAVELWNTKGIANLKLSLEIRDTSNKLLDYEDYHFQADAYFRDSNEKFVINRKAKKQMEKLVSDWAGELMYQKFGTQLDSATQINKQFAKADAQIKAANTKILIAWTVSFVMFLCCIVSIAIVVMVRQYGTV